MTTPALLLLLLSVDPARPRLGISDFSAPKEAQPVAAAANSLVANELQRLGAFEVSTAEQMRTLLGYDRQQQLLGCVNDACSSSFAAAVSQDFLVTGQLTKLKGTGTASSFSLDLQLISVKSGKRERGETVTGKTEQELIFNVTPAVVKLVQALLRERSGSLVLTSSEPAATVKVDDAVIGATPLDGKATVAGGPHIVRVEKDGFVTWQKEVRVEAGGVAEEAARLVPSPDTIAAWESKQTKLRIGAYAATGLGVAGVATAIITQVLATQAYGDANKGFVLYRSKLLAGIEEEDGKNYRTLAGAAKAQIATLQTVSWIGVGAAAAGAIGATALFLVSDDPGRYRAYREVKVAVTPTSGGAFAVLSGEF